MTSMLSASVFDDLQPAPVWGHFATLCSIPRPSKGEERLRQHLRTWAEARGLTTVVDSVGNLIVRKPASPGLEAVPGVVLQAHLDMVCQANADTPHDFSRDPIVPVLRDGWLVADGTTLGADNGIGVALILAALEDRDLVHGPLEALLTIDQDTTFTRLVGETEPPFGKVSNIGIEHLASRIPQRDDHMHVWMLVEIVAIVDCIGIAVP